MVGQLTDKAFVRQYSADGFSIAVVDGDVTGTIYGHLVRCFPYEIVSPSEDATIQEVASVLREWIVIWKQLFVKRKTELFRIIRQQMLELVDWRRELIGGALTQDQVRDLKQRITVKIDWGNKKLGLDLVPRINSEPVDSESISVTELYNIHQMSYQQSSHVS
ncbi:PREDICTED: dedicator of cytokinesis protein 3-like, partial [Priapulus caudatus]|uniref:Dedicator of cytokinesis protein 3-like n=1 Tax=Priapulus caudatus TaxID=37621 RepID=A0ABM1ETS8_PRICU